MISDSKYVIISRGDYMCCRVLKQLLAHLDPQRVQLIQVTGNAYRETGLTMLRRLFASYPLPYAFYEIVQNVFLSIAAQLKSSPLQNLRALGKHYSMPYTSCVNINAPSMIEMISAFDPDYIVSVICPQRIKKDILKSAKRAALNIHASLLPANAGVAPHFWTLAKGDAFSGSTAHAMELELDAGHILSQQRIRVDVGDSLVKHMYSISRLGSVSLLQALQCLDHGQLGQPQDESLRTYQSVPTAASLKTFYQRGHRLFRFGDFMRIVAHEEQS